MAAQVIGNVKSGNGKTYQVKWDPASKDVYVSYTVWSSCGMTQSTGEAINKAEAYIYNK